MGMFFRTKVENWGCFFVKKWTFPQRRVHYVQYQYFYLHFTYLGVRTHPRTHCLWACNQQMSHNSCVTFCAGR